MTATPPDRTLVLAYAAAFDHTQIGGAAVLGDLGVFCGDQVTTARPSPSTGMIDPLAMAVLEGRRQVWNHILGMLNLDKSAVWQTIEAERQRRAASLVVPQQRRAI